MKKVFYLVFMAGAISILFNMCDIKSEDQKFEEFGDQFIQQYFSYHPSRATVEGEHRYDHLLEDFADSTFNQRHEWLKETEQAMKKFDITKLSQQNTIDFNILLNQVRYFQFQLEKLQEAKKNPLVYTGVIGTGIYGLIARDFAPLEQRMENMLSRLQQIPRVLDQAKENLNNPPKIHTETAITQTQGLVSLIEKTLPKSVKQVPALKDSLNFALGVAYHSVKEFEKWLQNDLLPRSNGEFRLGKKLFDQKLAFTLESDLSRQEILKRAEKEFDKVREDMFVTALPLYRDYFPQKELPEKYNDKDKSKIIRAVLNRLSEDHPTPETILPQAREYLNQLTEFVRENNLVTLPDDSLEVIKMPEFRRGIAVAYCDSPGPLEEDAKTFFAVSPPPKEWSEQKIKSFYREYNNYMLQDLTIHEALPGHYVQIAHANQFDSLIRAIFASGTFVEGWAVYAEKMMIEAGYDGPEVKLQRLKMYLRAIINAILDQKIHTDGMSKKEAMALMMEGGFQEEGEAVGKWRRACLTSTQLSTYFVGAQEVFDVRQEYEKIKLDQFNLKEFHDTLLLYGSPAPKYINHILFESKE